MGRSATKSRSPGPGLRPIQSRIRLSGATAILLAVSLGLCGGYLDVAITVLAKYWWNEEGYFRNARDFPWTIPAGHAALLLIPGIVVAVIGRSQRVRISIRGTVWFLATLALWGGLLRSPLYGGCSLLLAVGMGRLIGDAVANCGLEPRRLRQVTAGLLGLLALSAAFSSGWEAVSEYRAVAGLPGPPSEARNVVLIVWDTVRAYDLDAYGCRRTTAPNLTRWAKKGVRYNSTVAAAPWTLPSHSCFFTGQWPYKLNTQWNSKLEHTAPTLAEYLASRGYQTAGFAANTNCCSYETGLGRGFAHFADYPFSPRALLSRTVPGKWLLEKALTLGAYFDPNLAAYYEKKWVTLQSRGAREINKEFLGWLSGRRPDRPFFAFLNYFDAHDPFVPPAEFAQQFGIAPRSRRDYEFLFDYVGTVKRSQQMHDLRMAADCYDDCIAFLDQQLGQLLESLRSGGLLENTDVIITSDHGEGFGDHGVFGHAYTINLEGIGVPLVILSPSAPAGRVVNAAVSLRDLPATVVDLLGLSAGSPFPGRSLAAYWASPAARGADPEITTPAFSEMTDRSAFEEIAPRGLGFGGFEMSLVVDGHHYTRNGIDGERLFDLTVDRFELDNLIPRPGAAQTLQRLRKKLLDFLTENPASAEVEKAYLKSFRERLSAVISPPGPAIAGAN